MGNLIEANKKTNAYLYIEVSYLVIFLLKFNICFSRLREHSLRSSWFRTCLSGGMTLGSHFS